jgi:hypothetical protein
LLTCILAPAPKIAAVKQVTKYTFIEDRRLRYPVQALCRGLEIHPSDFYAWLINPLSHRAKVVVFVAIERSIKTYEPQDFKLSETIREKITTEIEIYRSRKEGKADVFNYIELFYNPTRHHRNNNDLSLMEYEKNYYHANYFKIILLLLCYLF